MTTTGEVAQRVGEDRPRSCPGGCGRSVPSGVYVCRECWRALPPASRRAVNAAWRAVREANTETIHEAIARYERVTADAALILGSRMGL